MSVYVCTRDQRHRRLALELGAVWVGEAADVPPVKLDGAIIFAPAGELVVAALRALDKAGRLVFGGIHMSDATRQDGREFIELAARIPVRTSVQLNPLAEANRALQALKNDAVQGAAVLRMTADGAACPQTRNSVRAIARSPLLRDCTQPKRLDSLSVTMPQCDCCRRCFFIL